MTFDAQKRLRCDMVQDCTASVTMLDEKGYVYCTSHGRKRRESGVRCRLLRGYEVRRLTVGMTVKAY